MINGWILAFTAAGAAIMLLSAWRWPGVRRVWFALAALSALIAGQLAAGEVLEVRQRGEVFMTTIHELLLNPVLLACASYMGVFALYALAEAAIGRDRR